MCISEVVNKFFSVYYNSENTIGGDQMNNIEGQLNVKLFKLLQKECFLLLHTINYESNSPQVNAISWVYAPDYNTIRFAVVNKSRIVKNIESSRTICLTLIDDESTYGIYGNAKVVVENSNSIPLSLAIIEVSITEIRDVMFYGSKITRYPQHEKIYDKEAAAKLDSQVMDRLKNPRC
jgi:hypothetical protein